MKIPEEKQYEYLTNHLEYLTEKIFQFFSLFVKLATAIVGSVFFLHWKLLPDDVKRKSLAHAADYLFVVVSVSIIIVIVHNRLSWLGFRKTLSEQYPEIKHEKGIMRYLTEVILIAVIVFACIGFIWFNPLAMR